MCAMYHVVLRSQTHITNIEFKVRAIFLFSFSKLQMGSRMVIVVSYFVPKQEVCKYISNIENAQLSICELFILLSTHSPQFHYLCHYFVFKHCKILVKLLPYLQERTQLFKLYTFMYIQLQCWFSKCRIRKSLLKSTHFLGPLRIYSKNAVS